MGSDTTILQYTLNLDQNDGNPIGIGLTPATNKNGIRTTSASAYLEREDLPNLVVLTDTQAIKMLFDGNKAIGVQDEHGKQGMGNSSCTVIAG